MVFGLDIDQKKRRDNVLCGVYSYFIIAVGTHYPSGSMCYLTDSHQSVGFSQSDNFASALPGAGV
ncbi:hypothetical protein KUL118_17970 [Tenacibaculum sp. KUL118]|nr:hypothetical protein KUL118_17970 [Tenacibaculum sp. KUL118]